MRDPRPLLLTLGVLLAVVCSACGGGSGTTNSVPTCTPGVTPPNTTDPTMTNAELADAMEVLNLINAHRATLLLGALTWDATAAQVAYDHCVDMEVRAFFDHTNPNCATPGSRATDAGITWSGIAENIAQGQGTPAGVVAAWLASPGHRANIENPSYTRLGVGVQNTAGGPWWTTLHFVP